MDWFKLRKKIKKKSKYVSSAFMFIPKEKCEVHNNCDCITWKMFTEDDLSFLLKRINEILKRVNSIK